MITRKVYPFPKWYLDPPTLAQKDYANKLARIHKVKLPKENTKKAYHDFISYYSNKY